MSNIKVPLDLMVSKSNGQSYVWWCKSRSNIARGIYILRVSCTKVRLWTLSSLCFKDLSVYRNNSVVEQLESMLEFSLTFLNFFFFLSLLSINKYLQILILQ